MKTHFTLLVTIANLVSPSSCPSPEKCGGGLARPGTKGLSILECLGNPGRQTAESTVSTVPLARQDEYSDPKASINPAIGCLGDPRFRCSRDRFVAQLFFGSNPVFDIFSRFAAAPEIQLICSTSDLFSRWFSNDEHDNLLGCRHEGQVLPLVRDLRPTCRLPRR
jgi:hypothetical protein